MARRPRIDFSYRLLQLLAVFCLSTSSLEAVQLAGPIRVRVSVVDAQQRVVANAVCTAIDPDKPALNRSSSLTDEHGVASLALNWSGKVMLTIEKPGFRTLSIPNLTAGATEDLVLNLTLQIALTEQNVNVSPQMEGITTTDGGPLASTDQVERDILRILPRASSRIDEALPLIPGVVRSSTGEISIKGGNEDQNALRINGANVNDPVTGNFHLDLPSDSVDSIQVLQHPYTVENGQFVGGLTRVDTRRGSDKWRFEVNDFLPDVRIRSGHLRGIASDSPRLHLSGPIQLNRLYVSQSVTYSIDKRPIRGLPFPYDETKTESASSYSQIDRVPNPGLIQTFTVSHSRIRHQFDGLDFFHPQPATTDNKDENTVLNFHESRKLGTGILESLVSVMRFNFKEWPQGPNELAVTPTGDTGNYFASQQRHSGRTELRESYSMPSLRYFKGVHALSFGFDFSHLNLQLAYDARAVSILREDQLLSERIVFNTDTMANPIRTQNQTLNVFFQDRWTIQSNLSVDLGIRYENQSIGKQDNFVPRAAFAWSPFKSNRTTIRSGVGFFYDKVPLNVRSFSQLLPRTVFRFGDDGHTLIDRIDYRNVLVDSAAAPSANAAAENVGFVPKNVTWNSELVQTVTSWLSFRANVISSRTEHLYIVDALPDYPGGSAVVLHADGKAKYRALEMTAKFSLPQKRSILVSYVESRARGDLNNFNSYFGDHGNPILRPNQYSNLHLSTPHRLIAWGVVPLVRRITVSPVFEARSGFPFSVTDAKQQFYGLRNSDATRFPLFLALDMEVAKEFQVTSKYGIRLSVSAFNVTSHFNPTSVHANLADPQFGQFFASYHRYFTGGFDLVF